MKFTKKTFTNPPPSLQKARHDLDMNGSYIENPETAKVPSQYAWAYAWLCLPRKFTQVQIKNALFQGQQYEYMSKLIDQGLAKLTISTKTERLIIGFSPTKEMTKLWKEQIDLQEKDTWELDTNPNDIEDWNLDYNPDEDKPGEGEILG